MACSLSTLEPRLRTAAASVGWFALPRFCSAHVAECFAVARDWRESITRSKLETVRVPTREFVIEME